ncbi:hypothetical protein D8B26_006663 [Coccidioides posadasii str. Silveira]|nr:hypothetical protein D8B26_006663 [Coccidioides posadasii str. Silveira]
MLQTPWLVLRMEDRVLPSQASKKYVNSLCLEFEGSRGWVSALFTSQDKAGSDVELKARPDTYQMELRQEEPMTNCALFRLEQELWPLRLALLTAPPGRKRTGVDGGPQG